MDNRATWKIILEVIVSPLACLWAVIDGFFVSGRIEKALRKAGRLTKRRTE